MLFLLPEGQKHVACQKSDRRSIATSTRKQDGTSGVNQAPQVTGPGDSPSESFRKTALADGVLSLFSHQAEEHIGGCLAKIVEFYIPQRSRKIAKWLPPNERGKVLQFPVAVRQSA
jgi:hypothetical protein